MSKIDDLTPRQEKGRTPRFVVPFCFMVSALALLLSPNKLVAYGIIIATNLAFLLWAGIRWFREHS